MDAVDAGSKILNNSWGGYEYSTTIRMAFANAYKLNVVSVASMGNDNTSSVSYPAGFGQGIISVGATNRNDVRWEWDQHNGSNYGAHIDVVAPGDQIWSTLPYTNQYQSWTGTSMAAPHVSGIASLMLSVNPSLYNDDIEQIIKISADDVNDPNDPTTGPGWDTGTGTGRVNAKKALDLIRSPNTVNHWTASGGSSVGNTGYYKMTFYSTPGLASGVYLVKRYDVRKTVTFPQSFESTPHVWGRGVATNGYSMANPNFGMGWCDVVSNNNTSATLKTYVYKVYNILGQYLGWYPCQPSQVTFAYTVLGIPGESHVPPPAPQNLTITNSGQNGQHPHLSWNGSEEADQYKVWRTPGRYQPINWTVIGTTTQTSYTDNWIIITDPETSTDEYYYRVNAVNEYGESNFSNTVSTWGIEPQERSPGEISNINLPTDFSLLPVYPNPANPSASVTLELPEPSHVTVKVYDLTGREVVILLDREMNAGKHTILWNGKDSKGLGVSSGIYLIRMVAGKRVFTRKLTLMR